ncbi:MAG TPA: hypothetical protein VFM96_05810 [Gaiellaceae bacterium]|nr:hypothetical protein [Gaiellaceae bacterium]
MNIGLRTLLLLAAVVIFIVAIFVNVSHEMDWIAAGLACSAGAVLVREMGWDKVMMGAGTHSHSD